MPPKIIEADQGCLHLKPSFYNLLSFTCLATLYLNLMEQRKFESIKHLS